MGDFIDSILSFFSSSDAVENKENKEVNHATSKVAKKARKKQHEWLDVHEQIKFVCEKGKVSCPYASEGTGDIVATSTKVKLQDVPYVTAGDNKGAPNPSLLFKGQCTHSKWGNNKPMCSGVINLTEWTSISKTNIDSFLALLRKSTIKCTHSNEDISIPHSGQKAHLAELEPKSTPAKPAPPGYYYSKDGIFLGKIDDSENVYLTDKSNFEKMKKEVAYDESSVIAFTEKYDFTNKQLLDRANWVYGEGGGNYPDHYAHAIVNLKQHGVWGPAKKPFATDEAMYKSKMTHKNKEGKIINLSEGYFTGKSGGEPAKKFAKARKNPDELNTLPKANDAIKAVIGSIMKTTSDPTNGAYQWVGGEGAGGGIFKNPDMNNATGVVNVTADGRYHTFYKLKKE